jgi:hypothetical protein
LCEKRMEARGQISGLVEGANDHANRHSPSPPGGASVPTASTFSLREACNAGIKGA